MGLLERMRAHPAVESVSDERQFEGGGVFVYLNKGWEWSEQHCFGCETLTEAWELVRESKKVD